MLTKKTSKKDAKEFLELVKLANKMREEGVIPQRDISFFEEKTYIDKKIFDSLYPKQC